MIAMRAEEYATRIVEVVGLQVRLTSYRLGDTYHCTSDNVDPGAWLARTAGATREEAENRAIELTREMLERSRRVPSA